MTLHGLLLAAGSGSRMGQPKALVRDEDGTSWLQRSVGVLLSGGCSGVTVVLGAAVDEAVELLDGSGADWVEAVDWAEGMSASLRTGLLALEASGSSAALVSLVDLPDVTASVAARVAALGDGADVLARASYDGKPGHPVLLGRSHWAGIHSSATGDRGARDYLATHDVRLVECGDLATGRDVDVR